MNTTRNIELYRRGMSEAPSDGGVLDALMALWVDRAPGGEYFWAPEMFDRGTLTVSALQGSATLRDILDKLVSASIAAAPGGGYFWHAQLVMANTGGRYGQGRGPGYVEPTREDLDQAWRDGRRAIREYEEENRERLAALGIPVLSPAREVAPLPGWNFGCGSSGVVE